jgi:hypothetical protein
MRTVRNVAPWLALTLAAAACSGPASSPPPDAASNASTANVRVSPTAATLAPGASQTFVATVTGTALTAVTWSVLEPGNAGTVSASGLYTAPAGAGTYTVRADSVANPAAFGDAHVTVVAPTCSSFAYSAWGACTSGSQSRTVTSASPAGCTGGSPVLTQPCVPVAVSVTPSPASVDTCGSLRFTATVANATDTRVTWSVQEGAAGGTIATDGTYTAPSTAGAYHVVATSVADATARATSTVTASDHVLSVVVNPATASLQTGGTAQFTATVTTSCGSYVATGP